MERSKKTNAELGDASIPAVPTNIHNMHNNATTNNNGVESSYRDRPAEDLHEVLEGRLVVRVYEDKVLGEEEADHVVVVLAENRDATKPALEDHRQGLEQADKTSSCGNRPKGKKGSGGWEGKNTC